MKINENELRNSIFATQKIQESGFGPKITNMTVGEDFRIISDKIADGVRHITAATSALVCSTQIDFDLIDGKIHNLVYTNGCNGNLQAIGRLLEGMEAEKAMNILSGVNCNGRGTSCTDQLSRVLRSISGK